MVRLVERGNKSVCLLKRRNNRKQRSGRIEEVLGGILE